MSRRSFALFCVVVAGAGALASLAFPTELVRSHFVRTAATGNLVTLPAAIVVGATVVGVLVITRNAGVGALLVVGALGTGFGYWRYSTHPWGAVAGLIVTLTTALFPLQAALLHGRGLGTGWRRAVLGADVLLAAIGLATVGTAHAGVLDRWFVAADPFRSVQNRLVVVDAPGFARAMSRAWWIVLLVTAASAVAARWARWRTESRSAQRHDLPVVLAATAWTVCAATTAAGLFIHRAPGARQTVAYFTASVVPAVGLGLVAFAVGWAELVAPRLERLHAGRVEVRNVRPEDDRALRVLLADVLATSDVDVLFAHDDAWVDVNGRASLLPIDPSRATVVRRDGAPIAAIVHQPDVPFEAVDLATRIAAAHLEAQRATALARANTEAVREATARLVRAGDHAAELVAREVAAGPLPRLSAITRELRRDPATLSVAPAVLQEITAEVRRISHGVFPRAIDDEGLNAVLPGALSPPRRLPRSVEVTIYLLATAGDTAGVEDLGDRIVVHTPQSPTDELVARVRALGGTVDGSVATVPIGLVPG